jgi:hypothetical protein
MIGYRVIATTSEHDSSISAGAWSIIPVGRSKLFEEILSFWTGSGGADSTQINSTAGRYQGSPTTYSILRQGGYKLQGMLGAV